MNYKKEIGLRAPGLNRGFFLALEGLDGAGKSTQIAGLTESLRTLGLDPLAAKEPTGGHWGQKIRQIAVRGREGVSPDEELDCFVRDRAEDVAENIGPALLAGRPVIADRYILSNIAYQSALGLDSNRIRAANRDFPWPDLTVILEIPVAEGLARITSGRPGGLEAGFEESGYLARVKKAFDAETSGNIIRLDGRRPPAEITARIVDELKKKGFLNESPIQLVDTHGHLSTKAFDRDRAETVARARRAGVTAMLDVGLDVENSRRVLAIADEFPEIHPVLGWHPHDAADLTKNSLRELVDLASYPKVVGFGEIGLDFFYLHSAKDVQIKAFENLLEAATDLDRPVVIHTREAFDETLAILARYAPRLTRGGVIHCFTRDWNEASAWLDLGFHLSIPGVVTYPKNGELREAVARIPADRLLLETDCPYLTPLPFRGKRNEPSYLVYHLQAVAEARSMTPAEAAALTTANARRLFRLA